MFDTGYSDVLIHNAELMGIDLKEIDCIAISHSDNDHTRGLKFLNEYMDMSRTGLIAHPDCFVKNVPMVFILDRHSLGKKSQRPP